MSRTFSQLLEHAGYVKVQSRTRKPFEDDWQLHPYTRKQVRKWAKRGNVGLLCGYAAHGPKYYLWDFDKCAERGYECPHLAGALYFFRANAPERVKIVFRCDAELAGRKCHEHGIELLGCANMGVIYGWHPSGAELQWGGDHVPVLHPDTVEALWDEWTEGRAQHTRHYADPGPPDDEAVARSRTIVQQFLEHADIAHTSERDHDGTGRKYILRTCPFNPPDNRHKDDSAAAILIFSDGRIGATCHHARCQSIIGQHPSGWQFLLSKYAFAPVAPPPPLPAGAFVNGNGTVTLKSSPMPERQPEPDLPPMTKAVGALLAYAVNSPEGRSVLSRIDSRMRETFVTVGMRLLTDVASYLEGWSGDIDVRTLGKLLKKSHMAAWRNMVKFDAAGLARYRHSAKPRKVGEFPSMHLDLRPLVLALLQECSENVTGFIYDVKACNVFDHPAIQASNVLADFSGEGEYADVAMRVHHSYKGIDGRTVRSLTNAALNGLTLVAQGQLVITRPLLMEVLGMSKGSAAGATKLYEEIGLCPVAHGVPGKPKEYVFHPDWVRRLKELAPRMVSFNAHYRLDIGNINDRIAYIEQQLDRMPLDGERGELEERREKLKGARKKLIDGMRLREVMARGEYGGDVAMARQHVPQPKPKRHYSGGSEGRSLMATIYEGRRAERLYGVAV